MVVVQVIAMRLPFTAEQFFEVFRQYNEAVWPAQMGLAALAVACVALVMWPRRWSGVFISGSLAFLWAWMAAAYHVAFFSRINMAAWGFAAVMAAGAGMFFWFGVVRRRLWFTLEGRGRAVAGLGLVAYALGVYPALSAAAGHAYPHTPTFGLPCPTTLFTIGLLAFAKPPLPRLVLVAPLLWCAVGVQAAFLLGVPHDLALGAAGALATWMMFRRARTGPAGQLSAAQGAGQP